MGGGARDRVHYLIENAQSFLDAVILLKEDEATSVMTARTSVSLRPAGTFTRESPVSSDGCPAAMPHGTLVLSKIYKL